MQSLFPFQIGGFVIDTDLLTFEIRRLELEFRMLCDIVEKLEKVGANKSAREVDEAIELLSQAKNRLEEARNEARGVP